MLFYLTLLLVMARLKTCSLNVNGMQDESKRTNIFHFLQNQNCDIFLLQEVHVSTSQEIATWTSQWGGPAFWSCGSNRGRGVAILFNPKSKLNFQISKHTCDTEGRFLSVCVTIESTSVQLVNIYAPNIPGERISFFNNIFKYTQLGLPTLVGGDFNCVEDVNLDKWGGNPLYGRDGFSELQHFLSNFSAVDMYRNLNPQGREITWRDKKGTVGCRLDRVYLPIQFLVNSPSCSFLPCAFTDHYLVKCIFTLPDSLPRGRGLWKFNVSLLTDKNFCADVQSFWTVWREQKNIEFTDCRLWWDLGKHHIKQLAIQHSVRLSREKLNRKRELEAEFAQINSHTPLDPTRVEDLKTALAELQAESQSGAQIRSRAQWIEEGERPTKYFFNLENKNQTKKTITELTSPTGECLTTNKQILGELRRFYQSLYKAEKTDKHAQDLLLAKLSKSLSEVERESLEHELSYSECFEALNSMAKNKSPGNDGFPMEFYSHFWALLGADLVDTLNYGHQKGQLSQTQLQSVLSLLFKKGDRRLPKNWRPISLLNVDYKIGSKALANRLQKVLDSVLDNDQTCGVPGRSIFENLFLIRDVIEYANHKDIPGVLISLDQEKAFDRIDREFMDRVLEQMNFGPIFRQWIKTLYNGTESAVTNNGWLTSYFPVTRGVRQGCPLSPLLYCLGAEVLSQTIRSDDQIQGFKSPNPRIEAKCSHYADDLTLLLRDSYSVKRAFTLVNIYEQASGSKLNSVKSEGLWIGASRGSQERPVNINWQSHKLKILGVWFGYGDLTPDNWLSRVEKLEKKLRLWRSRALSLKGKTLIINTLGLSGLWYTASVLPIPETLITRTNKALWEFFWSGKTEQIKRDVIVKPPEEGGLGVTHLQSKARALRLRGLLQITDPTCSAKWVHFARYWMGRKLAIRPEWQWLKSNTRATAAPGQNTPTYSTLLADFHSIHSWLSTQPLTALTTRKYYVQLLSRISSEARSPREWEEEIGEKQSWPSIWCNAYGGLSTNWEGDLAWKILHRVVKTKSYLRRVQRLTVPKACHRCGKSETLNHVFLLCPVAKSVWEWVYDLIRLICDSNAALTAANILLRSDFVPSRQNKHKINLVAYLLKLALWHLWEARNRSLFDNQHTSSARIIRNIKYTIRQRISGSLSLAGATPASVHTQWGTNNVFCVIMGDELLLSPNLCL